MVVKYTLASVLAAALALLLLWLGGRLWRAARRRRGLGGCLLGGAALLGLLASTVGLLAAAGLLWYAHRAQPAPLERRLFAGVRYQRVASRHPRPLVMHWVAIDLRAPGTRFLVTPPAPDWRRRGARQLRAAIPSAFLRAHGLQLAINAHFFQPWHVHLFDYYPHVGDGVDVFGLAVSRGVRYARCHRRHSVLLLGRDNEARIVHGCPAAAALAGGIENAVSGRPWLVREGRPNEERSAQAPRTAVALTRDRRTLLLVVVDGRQPGYSEGVTYAELARLLVARGAYEAFNLDGGGSSALVAQAPDGAPRLLNSAIHRRVPGRERPVATQLGVFAAP